MRGNYRKSPSHRLFALMIMACMILLTLGCELFNVSYWVNRLDDDEPDQVPESLPGDTSTTAEPITDSNFDPMCLESPGTDPCPIEACVVDKGEYTASIIVVNELFGKSNPSDYQCCADYNFKNNSSKDLRVFEHWVTEYDDDWLFQIYPSGEPEQSIGCVNYFNRKDGKETFSLGITEIVVLYANPHCDWIQWDEPELVQYRLPIEGGCYQN